LFAVGRFEQTEILRREEPHRGSRSLRRHAGEGGR